MFKSISANTKATFDPLDVYLESPPVPSIEDPLHHWNMVLQASKDPNSADCALANMALDFLSSPCTSCPSLFVQTCSNFVYPSGIYRRRARLLARPPHRVPASPFAWRGLCACGHGCGLMGSHSGSARRRPPCELPQTSDTTPRQEGRRSPFRDCREHHQ